LIAQPSTRGAAAGAPGSAATGAAFTAFELRGISKRFGVVQAVDEVDLSLRPGEVHALVGENGAGKSTLIQIAAGVYQPDRGQIRLDGRDVRFSTPAEAEAAGVSVVYQELSLVPDLDVAQNIYLHREPRRARVFLDNRQLHQRCGELLRELGIQIEPSAQVSRLSVAQRQLVEIAKALSRDARVVIFDEPTASLGSAEEEHLFAIISRIRAAGQAILYVSHRLDEIFAICDVVTVLKDGRLVETLPIGDVDHAGLISLMVGRELAEDLFPPRRPPPARDGPPVLQVREASSPGRIQDVSLRLWPGEIVGIAGLIGSGRTSLLRAIFGADENARASVTVGGVSVGRSPVAAIGAGIAYVTEDRKSEGLALGLSNLANLESTTLARHGWRYRPAVTRDVAAEAAAGVGLADGVLDARSRLLSGGNQQKVVLGKWLTLQPRVLLCDEPTRGIDVGAKAEIYRLLRQLADSGVSILMASSELPEILGLADRVLVMRDGRLVEEFADVVPTEEAVMRAAAMDQPRAADQPGALDQPGAAA
jgi:ABC-type sugar transport system ATPase subunit